MKYRSPLPRRARRSSRLRFVLSLGLLAGLAACGGEPPSLDDEMATPRPDAAGAPPSSAPEDKVRVATLAIEPRPLAEEVVLTGELLADETVELRSQTSGHVATLHFDEGTHVRRGDLLIKIDDAALVAERHRVAVRLDFARRREARARTLREEETISQEVYEESASRVAELEAELGVIDTRIDQTEVRAPFDGVIGLRSVSVGSYLTPAVPVATLHALDPIKIDLQAPERYAQRIRVGDQIRFEVTGSDSAHQATVYATEPRIDRQTRTLRIRARAPNRGGTLLPGAFVRAHLELGTDAAALLVPSIALVQSLDSTTVFVVEDGIARSRTVHTGIRTEDLVEIVEGLDAGDEIIVSGVLQVQPGTAVSVAP